MTNKQKYNHVFMETFGISEGDLAELEYNAIQAWDSVGHMGLMAALEDTFDIMLDMEEIIDFSSYKVGIETLEKHNIHF